MPDSNPINPFKPTNPSSDKGGPKPRNRPHSACPAPAQEHG